jgi:hypothetical protein
VTLGWLGILLFADVSLTRDLLDHETGKPSNSGNGIWSSRGDGKYEFTFDADHPNAPGIGQIELEGNELLMTVTTGDGPGVMKIRFGRLAARSPRINGDHEQSGTTQQANVHLPIAKHPKHRLAVRPGADRSRIDERR